MLSGMQRQRPAGSRDGRRAPLAVPEVRAIFSDKIYLGESYTLVKPFLHPRPQEVPREGARYFDFLALGAKGVQRRHGWFDLLTRLIVQVG